MGFIYCVPLQTLRSTRVMESSRQAGQRTARGHCLSFLKGTMLEGEMPSNAVNPLSCD